jgi:glycosyltransferase involved in cell wall biosynthesis
MESGLSITHIAGSIEAEAAGTSYAISALAKACGNSGLEIEVLTLGPPGLTRRDGFEHHKFAIDWLNIPIIRSMQISRSMKLAFAKSSSQIVHSHGLWFMPIIYSALVKRCLPGKLVLTPHGAFSKFALSFSPWRKRLFGAVFLWKALAKVDMFHATSEQEYLDIRAYGYRQPVAVVKLGIDIPTNIPIHNKAGVRTVLYLGRIHPLKKVADLIRAWSRLESNHPAWRLRIVGPDELGETEKLKRMVASAGLKRVSIELPLYGADKLLAYANADLFVLPTGSENFAMTVAEALASAVPVICTKGAPWAGLEKQRCGWWTDIGDVPIEKALREAMALSPRVLNDMGKRGRLWMERDFSWADTATKMERSYLWLLGQGEKPDYVRVD